MGTWTRETVVADCGGECCLGRCPGHRVAVSFHRSSDRVTLKVGDGELTMTDRVAEGLLGLWREMREER